MLVILRSSRLATLLAVLSLGLSATPAARACVALISAEAEGNACCCPIEVHDKGQCPMHPGGANGGTTSDRAAVPDASCCVGAPDAPQPERTGPPSPAIAALVVYTLVAALEPAASAPPGPAPSVSPLRSSGPLYALYGSFLI